MTSCGPQSFKFGLLFVILVCEALFTLDLETEVLFQRVIFLAVLLNLRPANRERRGRLSQLVGPRESLTAHSVNLFPACVNRDPHLKDFISGAPKGTLRIEAMFDDLLQLCKLLFATHSRGLVFQGRLVFSPVLALKAAAARSSRLLGALFQ